MSPDLARPSDSKSCIFFFFLHDSRLHRVLGLWAKPPGRLPSPEQARAIPVVPRHIRARHRPSLKGPPTAVQGSLVHLLGSWEPLPQASQIRFLSVALTECLLSTQPRPPHTTPRYMCEK